MNAATRKGTFAVFCFIFMEIILVAILFFIVMAVAVLGDYGVERLLSYLAMAEDPILYYIRKGGKIFIVFADCIIVAMFIFRGIRNTYVEITS